MVTVFFFFLKCLIAKGLPAYFKKDKEYFITKNRIHNLSSSLNLKVNQVNKSRNVPCFFPHVMRYMHNCRERCFPSCLGLLTGVEEVFIFKTFKCSIVIYIKVQSAAKLRAHTLTPTAATVLLPFVNYPLTFLLEYFKADYRHRDSRQGCGGPPSRAVPALAPVTSLSLVAVPHPPFPGPTRR